MGDSVPGRQDAIDRFLAVLEFERQDDVLVGRTPDWAGRVVFGGIGLAMTVAAATVEAPQGTRVHAFTADFLRPMLAPADTVFRREVVKAGRAFSVHRLTASQDGKPVMSLSCSFTADTEGYEYDVSGLPADVAVPADLPMEEDDRDGDYPWDTRWVGPSAPREDGTREATHRHWFRLPRHLGEDARLQSALLAYATDWTGTGGRPLHLDGDTTGMVSLNHAAWFHRRARVDEWLLQDVQSLVNAGGRGTLRGVIRTSDGRIVASMAQEMLLRPPTD